MVYGHNNLNSKKINNNDVRGVRCSYITLHLAKFQHQNKVRNTIVA